MPKQNKFDQMELIHIVSQQYLHINQKNCPVSIFKFSFKNDFQTQTLAPPKKHTNFQKSKVSKSTDTRVTWAWWLKCQFFVTDSCGGFKFGGGDITVVLFIEYDPFWQPGCWILSKKGEKITPTVTYITWDPLPWQVFCMNILSDHVESPPTACTMQCCGCHKIWSVGTNHEQCGEKIHYGLCS